MNNYKLQFTEYFYFILQDVSGQVVLITGGGGGVGRHLALNFAELDARVIVWDINQAGKTIFFYLILEVCMHIKFLTRRRNFYLANFVRISNCFI